jgi:hypothetical protein
MLLDVVQTEFDMIYYCPDEERKERLKKDLLSRLYWIAKSPKTFPALTQLYREIYRSLKTIHIE